MVRVRKLKMQPSIKRRLDSTPRETQRCLGARMAAEVVPEGLGRRALK